MNRNIVIDQADGSGGSESLNAQQKLPRNIEAEAALLGALLIDNRIVEDISGKIRPEHFYETVHGRIYDRILDLVNKNVTVNPVTLKPYFENDAGLGALGGMRYLARLASNNSSIIGAKSYAEQIYKLALLRELVRVGSELVDNAMTSEEIEPLQQIENAKSALYNIAENDTANNGAVPFKTAISKSLQMVEKALNSGGSLSGVSTGLTDLNNKLSGLHNSDLLILAARPGMGKTSLATNIAFNAAKRWQVDRAAGIEDSKNMGAATAFFSLEMSAEQLGGRILSEQAEISSEKLRKGDISQEEFARLYQVAAELEELPLIIDDTPGLTIAALRSKARRLKRKHDIGLIIVDYLQLLQGTGRATDNRVNEISEISRGLKTLAKELDVPVIALSQLSRAVESREDKRPQLSDLRESGSIEQDADIVLFIYREEYYHLGTRPDTPDEYSTDVQMEKFAKWEEEHMAIQGRATVIVAKQRHGATGNVPLRFDSEFTRFSDLAREEHYTDYDDI